MGAVDVAGPVPTNTKFGALVLIIVTVDKAAKPTLVTAA